LEYGKAALMRKSGTFLLSFLLALALLSQQSLAWFDETHIMIGKAAGYYKWFNGAGADMIKLKAPQIESGITT
jgi:hypothetical protein